MKTLDTKDWIEAGNVHVNDIYAKNRQIATVSDIYAVAKVVDHVFKTQRGELQYDVSRGIPWFETVFNSQQFLPVWSAQMVLAAKGVTDVTGVKSFDYSVSGDTVSYAAVIQTIYGEATTNG